MWDLYKTLKELNFREIRGFRYTTFDDEVAVEIENSTDDEYFILAGLEGFDILSGNGSSYAHDLSIDELMKELRYLDRDLGKRS